MYVLPGDDYGGRLYNGLEDLQLLANSPTFIWLNAAFIVAAAALNASAIWVTSILSGVHRNMLDMMRTSLIWSFGIFIHYAVSSTSDYGEQLTKLSALQLVGFSLLVVGQMTYGGVFSAPRATDANKAAAKGEAAAYDKTPRLPSSAPCALVCMGSLSPQSQDCSIVGGA